MVITGHHLIAGGYEQNQANTFRVFNPANDHRLDPDFMEADAQVVDLAVRRASDAFDIFRKTSAEKRAELLETIADELLQVKTELCARVGEETALPAGRLDGELGRTVNQLRMFAQLIGAKKDKDVAIVKADPDRQPIARPDLRLTQLPIGPVAVFGASNFPLAFSVAGGDTAAALTAGCPVVVKGHPAHPGTSEIAGRAIQKAVLKAGLPGAIFALVQGQGADVGRALVLHPLLKAVGFTGSQAVGRALFDLASQRPEPIPVFAEMGSINPFFVLPSALGDSCDQLARQYADSLILGGGQFCTNPGLLIGLRGKVFDAFLEKVELCLKAAPKMIMLHEGIKANYYARCEVVAAQQGIACLTGQGGAPEGCLTEAHLYTLSGKDYLANDLLADEIFGPAAIAVTCTDEAEMKAVAEGLQGQLTATVHAQGSELQLAKKLFSILEKKAGRLLLNDFPTGVEVCSAMHHGGPYPASTDCHYSSVGTSAIKRFLRPVCYQNFTADLLPDELK